MTLEGARTRLLGETSVHAGVVGVVGVFFEQLAVNIPTTSAKTPIAVRRGLVMAVPFGARIEISE